VYKYDAAGDSWTQMGNTIVDNVYLEYFGWSNSLSADGTILAIGAIYYGNQNIPGYTSRTFSSEWALRQGKVKVYQYNASTNTWAQLGNELYGESTTYSVNGETGADAFGYSVSLSDDGYILAVGAPFNDGANGINSGHVRMFEYDGVNSWVKRGDDIDGEGANDLSGISVSLSSDGSRVAILAQTNDGGLDSDGVVRVDSGQARVYGSDSQPPTDPWTTSSQLGGDIDLDNEDKGSSISLSGDGKTVAIGSMQRDNNPKRGIVQLYNENQGNWVKKVEISGTNLDELGSAVALSSDGSIVAIGVPKMTHADSTAEGVVCVYQVN
jgi:pyruvate/2-oxoacid:ferredoxin oxidoreductase beta subunit